MRYIDSQLQGRENPNKYTKEYLQRTSGGKLGSETHLSKTKESESRELEKLKAEYETYTYVKDSILDFFEKKDWALLFL